MVSGKKKALFALLALGIIFMLIGSESLSVFFAGGKTYGMLIDRNGNILAGAEKKEFSYAQGELSAGSYGATYWSLKPSTEDGYDKVTEQEMTVFFNTHPAYCKYRLKVADADAVTVAVAAYNTGNQKDYTVYEPSTWERDQKVDVLVFGPSDSEKQTAASAT